MKHLEYKKYDEIEIDDNGVITENYSGKKRNPILKSSKEVQDELFIEYFQGEVPIDNLDNDETLNYFKTSPDVDLQENAKTARRIYDKNIKAGDFEWRGTLVFDLSCGEYIDLSSELIAENELNNENQSVGNLSEDEGIQPYYVAGLNDWNISDGKNYQSNHKEEISESEGKLNSSDNEEQEDNSHFCVYCRRQFLPQKKEWFVDSKGVIFCSEECHKKFEIIGKKCKFCEKDFDDLESIIDKIDVNPNVYLDDGTLVKGEYHKDCWTEIEKNNQKYKEERERKQQEITRLNNEPNKTPHEQKLLAHYQRILNTKPLTDEELAKRTKEQFPVIYQGNNNFSEWEATIDKNKVTHLEIAGSLKDNELIIKDYPNLRELYALNRNLETVNINSPKLEILTLSGNNLTELDVTNVPYLKTLTIDHNRSLSEIIGFEKLNQLEELTCFKCKLERLDCLNKDKLRFLACANQFVSRLELKVQGCINLEILDCAENYINNLDCSNLTKLKDVSCKESFYATNLFSSTFLRLLKENRLSKKKKSDFINKSLNANFENCTSLEQLNFSKSNINNLNVNKCSALQGVIGGWLNEELDLDENGNEQYILEFENFGKDFVIGVVDNSDYESDNQRVRYKSKTLTRDEYFQLVEQTEKGEVDINNYRKKIKTKLVKPEHDYATETWYDVEKFWKDRSKFPNLISIDIDNPKANILDDPEYGERIYQYEQEKKAHQRDTEMKQTDSESGLEYYTPTDEQIEASGGRLDLSWRGLSGNFRVANKKNLHTLNLGHNNISVIIIRNCPNLTKVILSHNGESLTKCIIWNCPKLDVSKQEQEGFWCYDNPNLEIEFANKDLEGATDLESEGADPTQPTQEKSDQSKNQPTDPKLTLIQIAKLINQAEQALNQQDYQKLAELVTEIEELVPKITDTEFHSTIQSKLTSLKQALLTQNTNPPKNYQPLIIGSILLIPLLLTITYLLLKNWVKYDLRKQIS